MHFTIKRLRVFDVLRRGLSTFISWACLTGAASAEPLSRKIEIDFFRDVPSRNLKGFATRSDGRLVAGPALREISTPAPADLLWCLEPTPEANKWLIGTGPEGRIVEITVDEKPSFTSRDVVKLEDPQVFSLKRLPDGSILAGTSPKGALCLIRDDKVIARVALPVDSIFDLLLIDENTALASTGNPGRIYKIDLQKFGTVGLIADKITDAKILADRGITVFGEIRDRNVRRIVALPDGRIAAGSAPKGNVYTFSRDGGAPVILQENRDAEITDLLPQPNGDLYATIVYSSTTKESRITPPASAGKPAPKDETPPPAQVERFGGRSALVWFPANGFAETLTARGNTAFYRVTRRGDTLLITGGEQGEIAGYDLNARLSLTFAGSISSQLNGIAPLTPPATVKDATPAADKFLLLRNNAPGLALLDFSASVPREAETRRLDLITNSQLGALRFNRLRQLAETGLAPEIRTSNGSDEVEGWGPWTPLQRANDGGWRAENLRGRYVKLRIQIPETPIAVASPVTTPPATKAKTVAPIVATAMPRAPAAFEIDRATLFGLPHNRRPQMQDFRVLTSGFGIIASVEQPPPAVVSLSQVIQAPKEDERRRPSLMSSQVIPSPGTQVIIWTVTDPDGDNLLNTFSIRRDGDSNWTDIVTATRDAYAQFDTKHLPDGIYFTRLVAAETSPRPEDARLSQTFETDDLIVDHTAPELIEAKAQRSGNSVIVSVHGRDALSLLDGIEVVFNNNVRETVEQPADGVRDGREETFTLELPLARVSNATSVEVTLYDAAGNGTAKRLTW
ncbi:MAG: hypothetical protein ACREF9_02255 [Opitutaceae bacterium]